MKKLLLLFLIFSCMVLKAQDNSLNSTDTLNVQRAAIYPGCDNVGSDNAELVHCFNQNISKDIVQNMDSFEMEPDENTIKIPVQLIVDKDGEIQVTKIESTNIPTKYLSLVKKALINYQIYMKNKYANNYGIKPAIDLKGNPVDINYTLNLTFQAPIKAGKVNPLDKGIH